MGVLQWGEGADKDLGVCVDLSIPKEVFYHTTRHFLITTHSGVYFTTILLFVGGTLSFGGGVLPVDANTNKYFFKLIQSTQDFF